MRASAQSTSVPFIQILPLPNGIEELLAGRTAGIIPPGNVPEGGYHSTVARRLPRAEQPVPAASQASL
jgi:hypothetical protein